MIDRIDRKLLNLIAADSRMTLAALSDAVGLSKSPCQTRLRRLEKNGYVLGYHAQLNFEKLGEAHVAFVQVSLSDTRGAALKAFNAAVQDLSAVEACHMIAGGFDYLLKVRTTDIGAYREVLAEQISALPHVASTSTFVSMQSVKE
ncbi:MAG: Lrp/AsnC ligand binding domain-containing protein [Rhodospirillales bacterium]